MSLRGKWLKSGDVLIQQSSCHGSSPKSLQTVQGSYATHDKEQETRATIGTGEVVIRDKDKQKQDVATINRDVEKAQVITKDVDFVCRSQTMLPLRGPAAAVSVS